MTEDQENQAEYQSKEVSFTVKRKPACVVEYKVKASPELVKKAKQEAVKAVSKEVSLPGFRKGRAPNHLVLKKFPDPIKKEWEKTIANATFTSCQGLAKIPIAAEDTQIHFDITNCSLEEGANITFSFESEPLVPEISLDDIELEEVSKEIIDEKVIEETLGSIQSYFAQWENVSERPAEEGDAAIIDLDIIEEEPHEHVFVDARFEIKKGVMSQWLHEMLIGMKVNDSKEGLSKPDADASPEDKEKFLPKKVRVTLKKIQTPHYPPIDDDLAQKVGVQTTQELRENLEKLLSAQADKAAQEKYRKQITTHLLEKYPFELPKTLLVKETQFRIKQLLQDAEFQKEVVTMNDDQKKEILKTIESQGEKAVRLFYLSRRVIEKHHLKISPADIPQESATLLEALFSDRSDLYTAQKQSQEQTAIAASRLALTKAEDFLISKAKIVPPKPAKEIDAAEEINTENKTTNEKDASEKEIARGDSET